MPSRVRIFVDFDGTISLEDTTDVVLERFADPSWQKVEAEWLAGHIGSRECMKRQVELMRATPEELDHVLSLAEAAVFLQNAYNLSLIT